MGTLWLLLPALLLLALVGVSALRRPILLRMALRNLQRRKAQALAIALGLMVGTAIISGSLATGDSMTWGVRQSAIQAFGPLDETIGVQGSLYFPQDAGVSIAQDAEVRAVSDGVEPLIVEDVAVQHAATRLGEPRAALIGVDTERDTAFGPYRGTDGQLHTLQGLGPDDAVINERLAQKLEAKPGDTLTIRYAQRPDLLVPRVFVFNGSLTAGAGPGALLPGLPPVYGTVPGEASFDVPVEAGAARVTAVLLWGSANDVADLDVGLQAPDGNASWNGNGTIGAPDAPALLNASAQPGTWHALVGAKAAVSQKFTLIALVFYEVHDLRVLQDFLQQVEGSEQARPLLENVTGRITLESRNFTVRFVAAEPGRGGFLNAPDVFVRLDTAQAMLAKPGRVNLVMVSNQGDEEQGLLRTPEAMRALDAAVAEVHRAHAQEPAYDGLRATALKQQWVEQAEQAGG
ncbi:MAG: ABC transporter permease, partial [Halobacteriales archaeon]|nr:ABC transporter permease [Halobacteriales archaeon]